MTANTEPVATPRTDALIKQMSDEGMNMFERESSLQDFARQLERELQAERERADVMTLQYDAELRHSEKVRKELAALKEVLVLVVKTLSESGYPSKAQWAEIQKTAAHLLKVLKD